MKNIIVIAFITLFSVVLTSCGGSEVPLTEAEQAASYGLSIEEFKEQKDAAARMNMTVEDHLKMWHGSESMDHGSMDMSDDSHMIEDDAEMTWTHKMEDWTMMKDSEKMSSTGTHIMEDGTVMTDKEHMETFHKWEDMEMHWEDEHRDY